MKSFAMVFLLCSALIFSGCSLKGMEGPSQGVKVEESHEVNGLKMNSVAILDRSLQRSYVYENDVTGIREHGTIGKIAVESTGSRRTATGTLETWALLRNRTNHTLQVEGKVQFFDKDKAPIEGPSLWQRLVLSPNSTVSYKESSLGVEGIAYYYIEVREGR